MKQVDIAIENALVLTMNQDFKIIENGTVLITGDSIIELASAKELSGTYRAKKTIDAGRKLVMPGLINTHTHAAMTVFRGIADDIALQKWLFEHIFPAEEKYVTADVVEKGTRLAIAEMLQSGTTTFNDMYFFTDNAAKVVDETGIRAVLNEGIIDYPTPSCENPEIGLKLNERLFAKWKNHSRVTIGVAAHAPYSCSADLLKRTKKQALDNNVPYHIHIAETRWEYDQFIEKYGKTSVEFLAELDVLHTHTVAAHSVHLSEKDIEIYAKNNVCVAHNPECNMKLASGGAQIPKLLDKNIICGIGTDGVASNNNLNIFGEMNSAALLHKFANMDATVLPAKQIVEMATIGGARVLGMENKVGSIEEGKKADLIIIDLNQPHLTPIYNIYSQIVFSMNGAEVETAIVNGSIVMENRQFKNMDLSKIMADVNEIGETIKNAELSK